MSIKVYPLDFLGQGALLQPKDARLHDAAFDFCSREVAGEINLSQYGKVFIAAEDAINPQGERIIRVEGVTGYVMRPDISLFRGISARATAKLHHRWHTFFADNGILGSEVLIHLSTKETDEQRCTNWKWELEAAQAIPADRYLVKVRAK